MEWDDDAALGEGEGENGHKVRVFFSSLRSTAPKIYDARKEGLSKWGSRKLRKLDKGKNFA